MVFIVVFKIDSVFHLTVEDVWCLFFYHTNWYLFSPFLYSIGYRICLKSFFGILIFLSLDEDHLEHLTHVTAHKPCMLDTWHDRWITPSASLLTLKHPSL